MQFKERKEYWKNGWFEEERKRKTNQTNLQLALTWVISVGTGLSGLYVLMKGILWFLGY